MSNFLRALHKYTEIDFSDYSIDERGFWEARMKLIIFSHIVLLVIITILVLLQTRYVFKKINSFYSLIEGKGREVEFFIRFVYKREVVRESTPFIYVGT